MAVRKPLVSGQFYSGTREGLVRQIEDSFSHPLGAGIFDFNKKKEDKTSLVISPHAGYIFSGPCASWAFKEVGNSEKPEIILLIGPSHRGKNSSFSDNDWETPLGIVTNAREIVNKLSSSIRVEIDNQSHRHEHSIEIQIPFLQYIFKGKVPPIIPLIVGYREEELAKALKQAIQLIKKKILIIVSSDFTHYGYNYDYVPFKENVKKRLYSLDREGIDLILKKDIKGFLEFINRTHATICGAYAIANGVLTLNNVSGNLLSYYTSGDIVSDYNNAVGYASIVFKE